MKPGFRNLQGISSKNQICHIAISYDNQKLVKFSKHGQVSRDIMFKQPSLPCDTLVTLFSTFLFYPSLPKSVTWFMNVPLRHFYTFQIKKMLKSRNRKWFFLKIPNPRYFQPYLNYWVDMWWEAPAREKFLSMCKGLVFLHTELTC